MAQKTPSPPRRKRKSCLIALIVVAVLGAVTLAVLASVLGPLLAQTRLAGENAICQRNLTQLSRALNMYADDWEDRYPPAAAWADLIELNLSPEVHDPPGRDAFWCPAGERSPGDAGGDYAFNSILDAYARFEVASESRSPLCFDSDAGAAPDGSRNITDPLASFVVRHQDPRLPKPGGNIAYVDGRLRLVPAAPDARAGL